MISPTVVSNSNAVPVQPGPGNSQRSAATSSSVPSGLSFPAFSQGMSDGVPLALNEIVIDLANSSRFGGACGVAFGLACSQTTGLTVDVMAGIAVGPGGLAYLETNSSHVCPDATTCYLWLTQSGGLTHATTTTPPTGAAAYLAKVTCAAGVVTVIDVAGVVKVSGGLPIRVTGDDGYPVDTPAFPMVARTDAGGFAWDGSAWRSLGVPTFASTIATTLALTATSANRQVIEPSGATRKVLVPSAVIPGVPLEIHNVSATQSITVRNSGDTTTLATLTAGQRAVLYPSFVPSGAAYPTATTV